MKLVESVTIEPTEITLGEDHAKHLDEEKIARLVTTLQAGGVLPPVVLDAEHGLIAGRNRYEAYGRAGLPVRADVIAFEDHLESMELAIRENFDRKKLTPAQEAEALAQLVWIEEQRDAVQAHAAVAERKERTKTDRIRDVASKASVSERKVQRAVERVEEARNPKPPAEPIVPKPPKPQPVETRLQAVVPQLEEIRLVVWRAVEDMRAACSQFKWGSNDIRRRYMQDIERALSQVAGAKIGLTEVTDRMVSGKTKIFQAPTQELGEKPRQRSKPVPQEEMPLGLSEAPKTGLKAPKRVTVVDEQDRPLLPPAEETANAWADAARVGVGPSDDGDNW